MRERNGSIRRRVARREDRDREPGKCAVKQTKSTTTTRHELENRSVTRL